MCLQIIAYILKATVCLFENQIITRGILYMAGILFVKYFKPDEIAKDKGKQLYIQSSIVQLILIFNEAAMVLSE